MRIAILSAGSGWHARDLQRAASQLGHDAVCVDFRKLQAGVGVETNQLLEFDAVIVRTMPPGSLEQVIFRMDILHRLQAEGLRVVNTPSALECCIDKYLSTAKLEAAGLTVPATIVCQDADTALEGFNQLGGDVVVKPLFGSEGRGMMRINDPELAWRTFRTLERLNNVIYLQKFVPHEGCDLRAFVLGDKVIAAMRRWANGDWRTNVAQGGRAEAVKLSADHEQLALRAATAVGAMVCGVDLLPGKDGNTYVLEVNAVPGWRALSQATGMDIARAVVDLVATAAHPAQASLRRST